MKKKLMATLLALALVLSLVPTVFAANDSGCTDSDCVNAECTGSNHKYACACTGNCTVSGNGHAAGCTTVDNKDSVCSACTTAAAGIKSCTCDGSCTGTAGATHVAAHTAKFEGATNGDCTACAKAKEDLAAAEEAKKCTDGGDNTGKTECPNTSHFAGCPKKCTNTEECDKTIDAESGAQKLCTTHWTAYKTAHSCAEANTEAQNQAITNCMGTTHYAGCSKKCPVTDCHKAAGHADKHEGTACTMDSRCPVTENATHTDGCPNKCTGEANCTAPVHVAKSCKSLCTMSASCTNTGDNHKANCVALCTFGTDVTVGDDTFHNGETCPNTSGDPSVHKAGCVKATVSDSVVLDANGNPVESEKPGEITKAEDFSDVNAGDWFAADLDTVIEKGWVKGNEDGSFDPEGDVSGEQAVVFVSRMLNKGFNTEGENWADEATAWADKDGLTEGIEITSEGIARKDLILLLWRAAGKPASEKEVTFSDLDGVEGDHLTALKWAVENGIILGNDDGTFTPDSTTSRSQISVILVRYDKAVNK